jgi:hypothetical protein
MTEWHGKTDAENLLENMRALIENLDDRCVDPPMLYFMRESDDLDRAWRERMEKEGWRREVLSGCGLIARWVKDSHEPVAVLSDDYFPEKTEDGKRVDVIKIRKDLLESKPVPYIPLQMENSLKEGELWSQCYCPLGIKFDKTPV